MTIRLQKNNITIIEKEKFYLYCLFIHQYCCVKVPFIRFHRRNSKFRHNYDYYKDELKPWIDKVKEITSKTNTLRIYFNDHSGIKAVIFFT